MKDSEIFARVDHTLLSPTADWGSVKALCDEAVLYDTASVCLPPTYVRRVRDDFPDLNICTVVGFPLGYAVTSAKVAEIAAALNDGANELDMVVNICHVKNAAFDAITDEIKTLKAAAQGRILKVIVETCYLTQDEKVALCHCVADAGADYIKTSTGFGSKGAAIADIELFKQHIGPNVKIKAAGGIKTRQDFEMFINAGCARIGTSSAVKILNGEPTNAY